MLKKSSDKNNLTKLDQKITKLDKILLLMLGQVLRLIRFSDSTKIPRLDIFKVLGLDNNAEEVIR